MNNLEYITVFNPTASIQLKRCVTHFKSSVFNVFKDVDYIDCWVAGGAIKDFFLKSDPNDIDVYFKNETSLTAALNLLLGNKSIYGVVERKDNERAIKLTLRNNKTLKLFKLDLVKIYYDSPLECIADFDFTCCAAAVTPVSFYHHPSYFLDVLSKELRFNGRIKGMSVFTRMQKYMQRGYYMAPEEMFKLALAIKNFDFNKPEITKIYFYEHDNKEFLEKEEMQDILNELKSLR